jgi:hypothetical protein
MSKRSATNPHGEVNHPWSFGQQLRCRVMQPLLDAFIGHESQIAPDIRARPRSTAFPPTRIRRARRRARIGRMLRPRALAGPGCDHRHYARALSSTIRRPGSKRFTLAARARPAALPHLRTFRHWTAPAECAGIAKARGLRPSRVKDFRLVAARARPADAVLRRCYENAALGAASAYTKRARRPLKGGKHWFRPPAPLAGKSTNATEGGLRPAAPDQSNVVGGPYCPPPLHEIAKDAWHL